MPSTTSLLPPLPVVPYEGPVVLADGRALATRSLVEWAAFKDFAVDPDHVTMRQASDLIELAVRDGMVLGLRDASPGGTSRFGMTRDAAVNADYHQPTRLVVVDPYDADGEPLRYGRGDLRRYAADRVSRAVLNGTRAT